MTNPQPSARKRIVFLDYVRVFACLCVMLVHSGENFYCGPDCTIATSADGAFWTAILNGLFRFSVPLFVMTSSYLLLPLKYDTATFFKRRFTRVCVPFFIWMLLYALIPQWGGSFQHFDPLRQLLPLLFNIPDTAGHLWFVYMLLGLYLAMPVISPWLQQTSRKAEEIFLLIWLFTTLFPYFHILTGSEYLYGAEPWNAFSMFWNVSGFIGYVVLAHYIREYVHWNRKKSALICIPLLLAGWGITAGWFYFFLITSPATPDGVILGGRDLYTLAETSFQYCSINVLMEAFAVFMLFKSFFRNTGGKMNSLITELSQKSYGMYLLHIYCLGCVFSYVQTWSISIPATIFVTGILTFFLSYLCTRIISFLPKGKYITG